VFRNQQIDLESLMMLTETNLMEMKIEIGPRKKILKAIDERRKDMEEADAIEEEGGGGRGGNLEDTNL
jgi:hypothetical protein